MYFYLVSSVYHSQTASPILMTLVKTWTKNKMKNRKCSGRFYDDYSL